jgi:glycosyltransferase involved in cell wall biosynthesis
MSPRVTVLMSVYNGQGFLRPAIQSILSQTFTDFEFLIIDDGSTDATVEIVRSFPDRRIKLFLNGSNIGLISSLNQGLSLATGEYIARMDADDISLSTRLERQVAFMDAHPRVGVCGSWLETFGIPPKSRWSPPADDAQIRCEHLFHSDIYHPTVILRKDFFAQHNLSYNKRMTHAEDYDLWVRAGRVMQFANIPEILLHHRIHHDSVGTIYSDEQCKCSQGIRTRQLRELGIDPSDEEIRLHSHLSLAEFETSRDFVEQAEQWLLKVQLANKKRGLFPEPVFSEVLSNKWFELCNSVSELGFWVFRKFFQSPLKSQIHLPRKTQTKFLIKCAVKRPATLPGKSARRSKNG